MFELFGMTLLHPLFLLLPLLFALCAMFCKPRFESLIFPHIAIFAKKAGAKSSLELLSKWGVIIFASIALSTPVFTDSYQKSKNIGFDIAMGLDASGSMGEKGFDEKDINKDKFAIAQECAHEFVKNRKNDNISLTVFGEYAILASPLTFDKKLLNEILNRLKIGIAGEKTAINDALAQMHKSLKSSKSVSKIGILLTDGMNTAGNIPKRVAVELIKESGIKVYTIGFGRSQEIDIPYLREIAGISGGEFFHAESKEVLTQVYKIINELEKSEIESGSVIKYEHLFIYPLFAATMCLLLFIYLFQRR